MCLVTLDNEQKSKGGQCECASLMCHLASSISNTEHGYCTKQQYDTYESPADEKISTLWSTAVSYYCRGLRHDHDADSQIILK